MLGRLERSEQQRCQGADAEGQRKGDPAAAGDRRGDALGVSPSQDRLEGLLAGVDGEQPGGEDRDSPAERGAGRRCPLGAADQGRQGRGQDQDGERRQEIRQVAVAVLGELGGGRATEGQQIAQLVQREAPAARIATRRSP